MSKIPALIGYRATGKTTVGKLLAARLGFECVDTDTEIVRRAGCSISEIFAHQGESAFRDLECQIVDEMTQREQIVLSLGGGAILRESNRQYISSRCDPVVWLCASVETIAKRIANDAASSSQRPNLTTRGGIVEIREILDQRLPLYESCSTVSFDTEASTPERLAELIFESME